MNLLILLSLSIAYLSTATDISVDEYNSYIFNESQSGQ